MDTEGLPPTTQHAQLGLICVYRLVYRPIGGHLSSSSGRCDGGRRGRIRLVCCCCCVVARLAFAARARITSRRRRRRRLSAAAPPRYSRRRRGVGSTVRLALGTPARLLGRRFTASGRRFTASGVSRPLPLHRPAVVRAARAACTSRLFRLFNFYYADSARRSASVSRQRPRCSPKRSSWATPRPQRR